MGHDYNYENLRGQLRVGLTMFLFKAFLVMIFSLKMFLGQSLISVFLGNTRSDTSFISDF